MFGFPSKFTPVIGGNFKEMIEDPKYKDTLILYNDEPGAESTVIRQYDQNGRYKSRPRSYGIPTFSWENGLFTELTDDSRTILLSSFLELRKIVVLGGYKEIMFPSTDGKNFSTRAGSDVVELIMMYMNYYCGPMDGSMC